MNPQTETQPHHNRPISDSNRSSRPLILVVDDDWTQVKILSLILRRAGCETIEVDNAFDALIVLRDEAIDLAVCDVRMPGTDGGNLAQGIRNMRRGDKRGIPVVLVSASSETLPGIAQDVGADAYCAKQDAVTRLGPQVRSILEQLDECAVTSQ